MNVRFRPDPAPVDADGLTRRRFSVAEVEAMQRAGLLEDERFELIDGEIVSVQAKNFPHERVKLALMETLVAALPRPWRVGVETTLYLDDDTLVDPDISILPRALDTDKARGPDIALVIEVAASTLAKDRGPKARLYARCGVSEYWVIDVEGARTIRHRGPVGEEWTSVEILAADAELTHAAATGWSFRLDAI